MSSGAAVIESRCAGCARAQSAELDLARCFDDGQAYVALSRVVSLQSLRLLSFDPRRVTANPQVVAFYARLEALCPPEPAPAGSQHATQGACGSQGG